MDAQHLFSCTIFFAYKVSDIFLGISSDSKHLPQYPRPNMASSKNLEKGIASLLDSEKYSDLTITTKDRSFQVHKAIVCTQSKVLAAMSDNGFRESSTAILPLEHDDPATVERMVTFFYTSNYDSGNPDNTTKNEVGPILMANTLVYSIADKYDIKGLKTLAQAKFENLAFAAWECKDFPAIVAEVFDTTPDSDLGLRDIVSQICAVHIDEFLANDTWSDLLSNNGAIGLAVFKFARQRCINEVKDARYEVRACESEVDWLKLRTYHLQKGFKEVREDLDSIVEKWDVNRGGETCKACFDGLYEGLKYDLEEMELPRTEESFTL